MKPLATVFLLCLFVSGAVAEPAADRLEAVATELESIVTDLEASQAATADLRGRLTDLEALSVAHQTALADQDRLLSEFRTSVVALEAHDRASLSLAQNLKGQLEAERRLNGWLWPAVGVAVVVAVAEGVALGWKR